MHAYMSPQQQYKQQQMQQQHQQTVEESWLILYITPSSPKILPQCFM